MTTSQSTKITIEESKMMFGEFDKEKVFIIEKSNLYKSLGKGVKIAEFVLLQESNKLIFLEAKSSSPRDDNKIKFDKFITDIVEKLRNALELFISGNLEIAKDSKDDNINLLNISDFKNSRIKFYLVINGHHIEWLKPIQLALENELIVQRKIWNIEVAVLNDTMAREEKLIL